MSAARPAGHTAPRPQHRPEEAAPDTGCQYAPRCTECPWRECVKELPAKERTEFLAAFRVVRSYLAAPDATIRR
jgi:hypothetical protein